MKVDFWSIRPSYDDILYFKTKEQAIKWLLDDGYKFDEKMEDYRNMARTPMCVEVSPETFHD